jgi:hypothetical protein
MLLQAVGIVMCRMEYVVEIFLIGGDFGMYSSNYVVRRDVRIKITALHMALPSTGKEFFHYYFNNNMFGFFLNKLNRRICGTMELIYFYI